MSLVSIPTLLTIIMSRLTTVFSTAKNANIPTVSSIWKRLFAIGGSIFLIVSGYTAIGTLGLAYTIAYYYIPLVPQLTKIAVYLLAGYGGYSLLV